MTVDNNKLIEKLGKIVGRIRKERGISQVELGKFSNTSQMTVQRIESGTGGTRIEALLAVVASLDMRLVDVFHELETEPSKSRNLKSKWEKMADRIDHLKPSEQEWIAEVIEKILDYP